jgi:hypothetical protein
MTSISTLRSVARAAGLGRLLMRLRTLHRTGLKASAETALAKARYLRRILQARPLDASGGRIELRMLLHKKRFLEGLWSLYSFVHFAGMPIKVAVHSDGSLDADCVATLHALLPGCDVIARETADAEITAVLQERGLKHCLEWRRRVIFALKTIDLWYYCRASHYCVLDSDILTFAHQDQLLHHLDDRPRYSVDNNDDSYAWRRPELERRMGGPVPPRLNAGLLLIARSALSLETFEEILGRTQMLSEPGANLYFSEQTAYACALGTRSAIPLNTTAYSICGDPNAVVTGHYCGGGYWASRFYREGLPLLAHRMGLTAG